MEGTMKLTQPEACEAMRAYLERRGALPAHGKVKRVSKDQYADEVQVDVEVGEAPKARVVCLCGSTRFKDAFLAETKRLTLAGKIVLSVGCFPHTDDGASPEDALGEDVKRGLDALHLRKIDLADEVLVLNVGGYVGESTRREIAYARELGKPVAFLEPEVMPEAKGD